MAATTDHPDPTWMIVCTTCQVVVEEGQGTAPAVLDQAIPIGSKAHQHLKESGDVPHRLELRRRGRVTESWHS